MISISKKQNPKPTPSNPYTGHIHTAQIDLYAHEVPNLREIDVDAVQGCISRDMYRGSDASIRSLHYNPNAMKLVYLSRPDTNRFPRSLGDCNSLADFEVSLKYWAEKTGIPNKCVHIARLDFAFDYGGWKEDECVAQIIVFRAIVAAFALKHGVSDRNQYEGKLIFKDRWKNIKAVHRSISMEAYDRRMEDPDSPVSLRLEMRYGEQTKYRPSPGQAPSAVEILHSFEDELRSLHPLLQRVEKKYNVELIDKFAECGDDVLEFIRANANRIYTRRQLLRLIFALDGAKTRKAAGKSADFQLKRYPFIFHTIKPKHYREAIDACLEALKKYQVQSGFFEKEIKIAESANPYADGLLERFTY